MTPVQSFAPGGYRFIPAVFQYSGGVAAEPGFRIERVTFPQARAAGGRASSASQRSSRRAAGRSRPSAPASCDRPSRSPTRASAASTRSTSRRWRNGASTTAKPRPIRSRAATSAPSCTSRPSPRFHAFSFTVASTAAKRRPSSSPAAARRREGGATYRERTVRYGETERRRDAREGRLRAGRDGAAACGCSASAWSDTTATQVYTVHDLHPFLADEIVRPRRGARRPHLALLPAAGARPRVRDGLPRRGGRAFRRLTAGCG